MNSFLSILFLGVLPAFGLLEDVLYSDRIRVPERLRAGSGAGETIALK